VVPQISVGSKEQRAAAIVPTVESGACYLPEGAAFTFDFVEEFAGFLGAAKHGDQSMLPPTRCSL
jgi:phage terminase large subunit-like protein